MARSDRISIPGLKGAFEVLGKKPFLSETVTLKPKPTSVSNLPKPYCKA